METETMEGYRKDSNVSVDLVVGGELAAQVRIACLIVIAAYQFEEAKRSWEMNEKNTTEDAIPIPTSEGVPSRYLTLSSEPEFSESGAVGEGLYNSNPSAFFTPGIDSREENDGVDEQQDEITVLVLKLLSAGFYRETGSSMRILKSYSFIVYLTATSSKWILLFTSLVIEIVSAGFDQASSPSKPDYALIGMLLAIVGVLVCMWELVQNGKKERIVTRRRGILLCFYYPPPDNRLFGSFAEITGLCVAIAQCVCSAVQYYFISRHGTNPMNVSLVAAAFIFGLLVSKFVENQRFTGDDTLQNGYMSNN